MFTNTSREEVNDLKKKLSQVRHKCLQEWIVEGCHIPLEEKEEEFNRVMIVLKDEVKQLQENLVLLEHQDQFNKHELVKHEQHLNELRGKLEQITSLSDNLLLDREQKETEFEDAKRRIQKEKEFLKAQDERTNQILVELEKAIGLFKNTLGVTYKKTQDRDLQIIFTSIDKKNPLQPYCFRVKIENAKYLVSHMDPPIADLPCLCQKLNETNNFQAFVLAVRRRFKDLC